VIIFLNLPSESDNYLSFATKHVKYGVEINIPYSWTYVHVM